MPGTENAGFSKLIYQICVGCGYNDLAEWVAAVPPIVVTPRQAGLQGHNVVQSGLLLIIVNNYMDEERKCCICIHLLRGLLCVLFRPASVLFKVTMASGQVTPVKVYIHKHSVQRGRTVMGRPRGRDSTRESSNRCCSSVQWWARCVHHNGEPKRERLSAFGAFGGEHGLQTIPDTGRVTAQKWLIFGDVGYSTE